MGRSAGPGMSSGRILLRPAGPHGPAASAAASFASQTVYENGVLHKLKDQGSQGAFAVLWRPCYSGAALLFRSTVVVVVVVVSLVYSCPLFSLS